MGSFTAPVPVRAQACLHAIRAVLLAGSVVLIGACGKNDAQQRLVLTGSSTVAPLAAELAVQFEKQNPQLRIDVQTGGSSRGVQDARKGLADIGMASRTLKPDEQDLVAHTIAWDGIAPIVHQDNPLQQIDRAQLQQIYTGAVRNWQELGGADVPIVVIHKAEGRSTQEIFLAYLSLSNREIRADIIIGDNQQGLKSVAGQAGAIGYVSVGAAEHEAGAGAPIRLLDVDGQRPSQAAVASGGYPMSRPLNLLTRGSPSGLSADFIAYARSQQAKATVRALHFVPVDARQ